MSRREGVQPQKTLNGTHDTSLDLTLGEKAQSRMPSVESKPVFSLGSESSMIKASKRFLQTRNKSNDYVLAKAKSGLLNADMKAYLTQIGQYSALARGFASTISKKQNNTAETSPTLTLLRVAFHFHQFKIDEPE